MAFSGDTTILTTEGVKHLRDLVNKPFSAIVDNNIFPCHLGVEDLGKKDLYLMRVSNKCNILTTFDQEFINKRGVFKPIQEFSNGEKIKLSISAQPFDGVDFQFVDYSDIIPEFEFYSSKFYKEFFTELWNRYGLYSENNMIIDMKHIDVLKVAQLIRMLTYCGIHSLAYQHRRIPAGIVVSPKQIYNFIKFIDLNEDKAYELIKGEPKENYYLTFRNLEYYETSNAYSCSIEGANAFSANCLYTADCTYT